MNLKSVKKLIRDISKATHDPIYGDQFSDLLSAMRGPDNENEVLKEHTTCIIRSRLGWKCGLLYEDGSTLDEIRKYAHNFNGIGLNNSPHFINHIESALKALKLFGFDKPKKVRKRRK